MSKRFPLSFWLGSLVLALSACLPLACGGSDSTAPGDAGLGLDGGGAALDGGVVDGGVAPPVGTTVGPVLTACSAQCVDVETDRNHCGACGVTCEVGASCKSGECSGCPAGQASCGGICTDTNANPSHCGACGNSCGVGGTCVAGECIENNCDSTYELQAPCGAAGACLPVKYNNEHCGGCGIACDGVGEWCEPERLASEMMNQGSGVSRCRCPDGQAKCGGKCSGLDYDTDNCGGCGVKCADVQYCEQGQCRCGGDQILCGGKCRSPSECSTGGGTSFRAPFELPGFELQAEGDGTAECGAAPGDGGMTGGGTTGGGTVGGNTDAGAHCGGDDWFTGKATWYTLATPLVHCSYPTASLPKYYGAINDAEYAGGDVCGACVEVEAEGKKLEIEIVDECPYEGNETWCYAGSNHIDLSPDAFLYFAPHVQGVMDIKWRYVPCSAPGELELTFKDGSSIYWTAIQIRNHPVPLASVEVLTKDGTYRALARQEYNYWLDESGFGSGPYTLRITDTSGAVLVKDAIPTLTTTPLTSSQTSAVGAQIASCQ